MSTNVLRQVAGQINQVAVADGGDLAVIFDDAVAADKVNIRSNRLTDQSPIDNTGVGITNLSSDTSGTSPGATGDYSTIGGGDLNEAAGLYACVPGGGGNVASGEASFACCAGSTASGVAAFARGNGGTAAGDGSSVEGQACSTTALAVNAHSEGFACSVDAPQGHAEGANCAIVAGADQGHAEGSNTIVGLNATNGHAEGLNSKVFAAQGHAEGNECIVAVGGTNGHAEGSLTTVAATGGHAEGEECEVLSNGDFGHAEGSFSSVDGFAARASGIQALATRESQSAHASGMIAAQGDAQTSLLVLRGTTPGAGAGESVELLFGTSADQFLTLEDGKGYILNLECVASGNIAAVPTFSTFNQKIAARRVGATITLALGTQEAIGEAGAATWTFTATAAAGPTRLALTFTTGATTAEVNISCKVRFTEVVTA